MKDTVERLRSAKVPRCQAWTKPKWYSPKGHQCPFAAITELDGQHLCKMHADMWVRSEGATQNEDVTLKDRWNGT